MKEIDLFKYRTQLGIVQKNGQVLIYISCQTL